MNTVRLGIIGLGGMGQFHLAHLNQIKGVELTAICDIDPDVLTKTVNQYQVTAFKNYQALLDSNLVDAILIATPHYAHTPIAIDAFQKGIHVLCEKPVAVHVKDAQAMNRAWKKSDAIYAAMFQFRGVPLYQKAKSLIESGEIGVIMRINYIVTDWFRSQTYYNSGGWRATWKGEGGGVLLNQCPHSLDLLWWLGGAPQRITAISSIGKYHDIEVEDEVTAILEYANGAVGIFVTSTGEAPGTNLLEICGDRGKLVIQNGQLMFYRTRGSVQNFRNTTPTKFDKPEIWAINIPLPGSNPLGDHQVLTQNFVNAILHQEPLIAPGNEGIYSLEIGNAMLMSGLKQQPIDLPLDADKYASLLDELIQKSTYKKQTVVVENDDFTKSFHA